MPTAGRAGRHRLRVALSRRPERGSDPGETGPVGRLVAADVPLKPQLFLDRLLHLFPASGCTYGRAAESCDVQRCADGITRKEAALCFVIFGVYGTAELLR